MRSEYDLTVNIEQRQDALVLDLVYNQALFDESRITALATQLTTLVDELIASSSAQRLKHLSLLTQAEQQQVLACGRGVAQPIEEYRVEQ